MPASAMPLRWGHTLKQGQRAVDVRMKVALGQWLGHGKGGA